MKRAIVYDVTHLRTKLANASPTGIDRVDLAFARHVSTGHVSTGHASTGHASTDHASTGHASTAGTVLAAHYRRGSPKIGDRAAIRDLVRRADLRWNTAAPADEDMSEIIAWLNGREPARRRRRSSLAQAAFLFDNGVAPAFRRLGFARSDLAPIPPGAVYLNVAQYMAQHGTFFRWLRERDDMKAVFFVHDLIPLDFPEYWAAGYKALFSRRIDTIFAHAKAILVASEDVRSRISFEMKQRRAGTIPVFASALPTELRPAWSGETVPDIPYFVVLGTIEPRKNHHLVLNVWRRLAARGGILPKLLILGRRGWRNTHVVDMIERCEGLRGHVLEVSNLSSPAVDQILSHARALLMPSFAEGFGLPVVEALRAGTPVIASDIPVFREVSQGKAIFRDPLDGLGWSDAVEALCDVHSPLSFEARARAREFPVRLAQTYFAEIDGFLDTL